MTRFTAKISMALKQGVFETAVQYFRDAGNPVKAPEEPRVVELAPLVTGFREVEIEYAGKMDIGSGDSRVFSVNWTLEGLTEQGLMFEGGNQEGAERALWVPWASVIGMRFLFVDTEFSEVYLKTPAGAVDASESAAVKLPVAVAATKPAAQRQTRRREPGDYLQFDDGKEGDG